MTRKSLAGAAVALALAFALAASLACSAQGGPTSDEFKQVLNKKLQALLPTGMTERNVLFQDLKAGAKNGGTYLFMVTALVRDYGPGYPPNHYYGSTCVQRFENAQFSMYRNGFGQWDIDGALNPPAATGQCKDNPAEGVSSMPVSSLNGTLAPTGEPAAATSTDAGSIKAGQYACWASSTPQSGLNFKITSSSSYIGSDSKPGSYTLDSGTGQVTFKSGSLAGAMSAGYHWTYDIPGGRPTASLRDAGNREVLYCQWVR